MKDVNIVRLLILALTIAASDVPAGAQEVTAPAVFAFDEIDHVYSPGAALPPPDSFDQDLREVVHTNASPAARKKSFLQGAMQTLNVAGTQLNNAVSIVGSSGTIGQTLNIANGAAAMAPIANMMGLAGTGKIGVLLQTYLLPNVSPSGAQLLSDFLTARSDAMSRYPRTALATATETPDLATYGHGSLRKYSLASNGWVRIDDPDAHVYVVLEPDVGKIVAVDDANRTIRIVAYDTVLASPLAVNGKNGTPLVTSKRDALGTKALARTSAEGFHTHVIMHVAADNHGCAQATVTSDRVEYFAPIKVPSAAANTAPLAPTGTHDDCVPAGGIASSGAAPPADQLLLYQANTVERKTAGGILTKSQGVSNVQ